ncbi:MAG: flagellar biosynthesis protein FlgB [Caulobacterales bacterium]
MTLDDMPLFAMLKSRMGYLSQRQTLIAQNVANSDTPGYAPRDLKPFSVVQQGLAASGVAPVAPVQTSPMHLTGTLPMAPGGAKPVVTPDSETTLNGNSVVLEEEMLKLSQSRMDYDTAVSFYQKSMALLQTALRKPGG